MMNHKNKNGFTLLETLLTVFVLTAVYFVIFGLLDDYKEKKLANSTTQYINTIATALNFTLSDPEVFQKIYNEADLQANDILEITLTDIANGGYTSDAVPIPPSDIITASFANNTPYKTGIFIMFRIGDDVLNANDSQAIQIIITSDDLIDSKRIREVASQLKNKGGFFTDPTGNIRSAYASWAITPASLTGTNWATTNTATPPNDETGYLFYYDHVSYDVIAGDYLYRVNVPGSPELNAVYGDFNMGGNNILGADDLNANNMIVEERVTSNANMNVTGTTTMTQSNLIAGSTFAASNNAIIRGVSGGISGNFITAGELRTGSMQTRNSLNAGTGRFDISVTALGDLNTNNVTAQTITSETANISTIFGTSTGTNISTDNKFRAQDLNAATIQINSGNAGLIDSTVTDSYNITGTLSSPGVNIQDLNVGTFGECDQGC